jgi:hypothetical protein
MSGFMGYIVLIIVIACLAAWGLVELVGKRIEKEKAGAAPASSARRSTGKASSKSAAKSSSKARGKSAAKRRRR